MRLSKIIFFSILVLILIHNKINAQIEKNINLNNGWNLISSPLYSNDLSKNTILPSAISQLFAFNNGYSASDSLKMGKGFWIKYPNNATSTVNGQVFNSNSIPVYSGWNLIGIYNYSVNTNQITFANGTISSQFFDFNNGYSAVTTLEPGKGYWVKVSSNGSLTIPVALPSPPSLVSPTNNATNINTTLTFAWNSANAATTYNLQIADNIQFTNALLHTNIANTSYQVNNLLPNKTYYWRVSSTNTAGTSNYSNHWSFTTKVANSVLVTPEFIGNPFKTLHWFGGTRSNNVWDLHLYNGKIYIGAGDISANTGPIPAIRYNPVENKFEKGNNLNEEHIDVFYTFANVLWTPGIDPKEGNDFGNVYKLTDEANNNWTQVRKLLGPELHTFCMTEYKGSLFAGGYRAYRSNDGGQNWSFLDGEHKSLRIYTFLTFPDQLYAVTEYWGNLWKYDGTKFVRGAHDDLFPNTDLEWTWPDGSLKHRYAKHGTQLIGIDPYKTTYIGTTKTNPFPFGLYLASSIGENTLVSERVMAIGDNYRPWDIKLDKTTNTLYILTEDVKTDFTKPCMIRVWKTTDLITWTEILHFSYNTYAVSFEIQNGDFYFGMGSETKDPNNNYLNSLKPEIGNILRVKKEQYEN